MVNDALSGQPGQLTDVERRAAIVQCFGNPLRLRMIEAMSSERELSPTQLATILGSKLGVTSYHMRFMRDKGAVRETRVEPRRGALEHYYVLTPDMEDVKAVLIKRKAK